MHWSRRRTARHSVFVETTDSLELALPSIAFSASSMWRRDARSDRQAIEPPAVCAQDAVRGDRQLQAWAEDLAGKGKVGGMPERIDSVEELVAIIANVIFICGPQHSALNFTQARPLPRPALRVLRPAGPATLACAHADCATCAQPRRAAGTLQLRIVILTGGKSAGAVRFVCSQPAARGALLLQRPGRARREDSYHGEGARALPALPRQFDPAVPDHELPVCISLRQARGAPVHLQSCSGVVLCKHT